MSSDRRSFPSRRLALVALGAAASTFPLRPVAAQTPAPPAHRAWVSYAFDLPIARRFAVVAEAQGRFDGAAFGNAQQILLRAGLDYALVAPFHLSAGWGYLRTDPETGAADYPEHRIWEQALLASALGPVGLSNRVRVEQRWVGADALGAAADDPAGAKWLRLNRVRYQLRGTVPVGACLPRLRCYVAASDELFVGIAPGDGRALSPEQNRAALAVGSRVLPALRVELGYLNQAGIATAGTIHVRTHALTVNVTASRGGSR